MVGAKQYWLLYKVNTFNSQVEACFFRGFGGVQALLCESLGEGGGGSKHSLPAPSTSQPCRAFPGFHRTSQFFGAFKGQGFGPHLPGASLLFLGPAMLELPSKTVRDWLFAFRNLHRVKTFDHFQGARKEV